MSEPTPRTDAQFDHVRFGIEPKYEAGETQRDVALYGMRDFARQLEIENSELRKKISDSVSYAKDQSKQFVQCAGHHFGKNDGAEAVAYRASEILDRIVFDLNFGN